MTTHTSLISGKAAAIRIENLDTDQIMPKQFLHGIDKSGLAQGLLYNLRFDPQGRARSDFVLNQPQFAESRILIGGANFGCGSSREHAVWGLLQYGIHAVIAPSFGEIFYSNAMNNRLMLVMLPPDQIEVLMREAEAVGGSNVTVDVATQRVHSQNVDSQFQLSALHRQMFLEGLDVIGMTLKHRRAIDAFTTQHWHSQPWVKDVAALTCARVN
ncbi:3-isopropylmalate dehydratase small subunit [Curvibacter sp. RS43]|uniref:3-isopropylmalate dehydratase small subunit n=1 Tax=Curvibacter microcysteis TaxID=3026419 RepID=UPI00235FE6AE|nr:3-isopropylmalate dehydratase small subunit [Curvibacter sp. RS43]MDD0812942.1 3-isopropylmalate dehydratase small subunit [Curvibacter sp. RS43]